VKVEALVDRLERAKRTGSGRWIARCPAHNDKNPSMSVRELEDGRVLIHCFAGCAVEEIVAAVGMTLSDLFPDKPLEHGKPLRRPVPVADVLECIAFEAFIVVMASSYLREYGPLSDEAHDRLILAQDRIDTAKNYAVGNAHDLARVRLESEQVRAEVEKSYPHG
jgi:CHC2-type zinc finger protein